MTELLHHSRSNAELRELRPGSRYEASLVLVPPPRALTELFDPTSVEFTTAPYVGETIERFKVLNLIILLTL